MVVSERLQLCYWLQSSCCFPCSKRETIWISRNCQKKKKKNQQYCIRKMRSSVFTWPFHKPHWTYVLFWKRFPALIPSSDLKICPEPLLLGLGTFDAGSGSDMHYSCLRRWLISPFWEPRIFKEELKNNNLKALLFQTWIDIFLISYTTLFLIFCSKSSIS